MRAEQLKQCPFCGSPARLYDYDTETDTWPVSCDNRDCGAEIQSKDSAELAVAAWNRRATPEPVVPAMPAPDWSQAPTWAQWWASDQNGFAFWYAKKPQRGSYYWMPDDSYSSRDEHPIPDWRTTLQQRPQP